MIKIETIISVCSAAVARSVWDGKVAGSIPATPILLMETLMLVIYTRDECPYCAKLEIILDSFAVEYTPYKLGVDFDREAFYNEFGEGSTFPRVVLDGSVLGGCTETLEFLTSIGCLQEEKDMECMV